MARRQLRHNKKKPLIVICSEGGKKSSEYYYFRNHTNIAYYKVSMNMKKDIDEYFKKLELLPSQDFIVNGIKVLDKKFIKSVYDEINKTTFKSVKGKIDRLILLLEKYINDNFDDISKKYITEKISQKTIENLKNNINNYLKKYFVILNKKIKTIYIDILEQLNLNSSNISKNVIYAEDIPALMYIKYKFTGSREFDNYKHIVIDEAQDYGEFTFYVLKKMFKNSSFSIYGDLAQSLYSYRSINNWECLEKIFDNFEILKLNKSYRTTIEIMDEANKINELLKLDKAIPVIRHGEEVEYINKDVFELVSELKNKYKTVAIITKNQEEANCLYDKLKSKVDINLINSTNLNYDSNINILSSYLSKGLEFDSVIIVNKNNYKESSIIDMKLLYVSMTRALHKLIINI